MATKIKVVSNPLENLSEVDCEILTTLAFSGRYFARTVVQDRARWSGVSSPTGGALSGRDVAATLDRLVEQGLVVVDDSRNIPLYGVVAGTAMAALAHAERRGRLGEMLALGVLSGSGRTALAYGLEARGAALRVAFARADRRAAAEVLARLCSIEGPDRAAIWLLEWLGTEPRPDWLELIPDPDVRAEYVALAVRYHWFGLAELPPFVLESAVALNHPTINMELGRYWALRGDNERAEAVDNLPKWGREGIALLLAFWGGKFVEAAQIGEACVAAMKTRKMPCLPDLEGLCHFLALAYGSETQPSYVDAVVRQIEAAERLRGAPTEIRYAMGAIHRALIGEVRRVRFMVTEPEWRTPFSRAFAVLVHDTWMLANSLSHLDVQEVDAIKLEVRRLAEFWQQRALATKYLPVERELEGVLRSLAGDATSDRLAAGLRPPERWEAALACLEAVVADGVVAGGGGQPQWTRTLLWEVSGGKILEVIPRVRKSARARRGQPVSLATLLSGKEDAILTDLDRRVIATGAKTASQARGRWRSRDFDDSAVLALVGHPRVVGVAGEPVSVERGTAKLHTRSEAGVTRVELVPSQLCLAAICHEWAAPDRLVVYERTPALTRVAEALSRAGGLAVPSVGVERLTSVLKQLAAGANLSVEGDVEISAEAVAADATPIIQLGWDGTRLTAQMRVAPLGEGGPMPPPGVGVPELIAEVRSGATAGLRRTIRDLADERRRCDDVLERCPVLSAFSDGDLHFTVPSLADALEVVVELDALGDRAHLAWHAGQKLQVPKPLDASALQVRVTSGVDWIGVGLALKVNEDAVLKFKELIEARVGPRFVVLPRGQFALLSERLRRHLDGLSNLGSAKGGTVRTSVAALPLIDELTADLEDVSFDADARARLDRLRELASFVAKLPRGFASVLRDYQRAGFEWMARLAEAGLGGVLADDMGLGKTVQTLALLSQRAKSGPALVVSPTSVVLNWVAEAERFAPGLRVHVLARAADRAALIAEAGPRDVVVCSYGLLASETEALASRTWTTVVFDEAHALKNPTTQRAEASRRLLADFRLGLTGTPIENHLGELWSLFATLIPGLLGTQAEFDRRFTGPVGRGDRDRAKVLRAIVRPFMLRRLKSQVLEELPPRTELTLRVAPTAQQHAYYEASRRAAVERIAKLDRKKARFAVLAEITRLRQAAIDPRLIDPDTGPPGAKIEVLFERLGELRAEGHRALIFTQFLGSMAAVCERLEAEKYEFLALDGSTSAAERKRRIDGFQAGEADVFVLSLRAGGTGVNLTAADYVFHLDPWWNPAVEDQATDRAHRIGQERPVTVYRLVTEGTIEEKILALHDSKRELADDLLAGMEQATALDLDQLVGLLEG